MAIAFAYLYIDNVEFNFSNLKDHIKYYNIEIEINKKEIESNHFKVSDHIKQSHFLYDFKDKFLLQFPHIKEWIYSKYLTGKAIQTLIEKDNFQDIIDEQGNLTNIAYTKIEEFINEQKL